MKQYERLLYLIRVYSRTLFYNNLDTNDNNNSNNKYEKM